MWAKFTFILTYSNTTRHQIFMICLIFHVHPVEQLILQTLWHSICDLFGHSISLSFMLSDILSDHIAQRARSWPRGVVSGLKHGTFVDLCRVTKVKDLSLCHCRMSFRVQPQHTTNFWQVSWQHHKTPRNSTHPSGMCLESGNHLKLSLPPCDLTYMYIYIYTFI